LSASNWITRTRTPTASPGETARANRTIIAPITGSTDWTRIDLRHLSALAAVAEARSISRAAERLGYTQSAVSQQIRSLERIVGVELLVRAPGARHVELTDAGHRLLAHAAVIREQLIAAHRELSAYAAALHDVVRLGAVPSAARIAVAPLALELRMQVPDVVLEVEESYRSDTLLERLVAGDLDLVLAPIAANVPGLEATEIYRDSYVLLVAASDPLVVLDRRIEPADLAGRALVSKDCGTPSQRALATALSEFDVDGATAVRAHDGETVRQLVAQGVGIAVLPRLLVDDDNPATRMLPLDHLLPPRRLGLYERAEGYRAPAVALAAAILRSGVRDAAAV
jgi:DNA-binding transcriptional LysR family regulator